MLTEFVRDHAFTIAWFGLMALVWFGWAQEDPPRGRRAWIGAGSVLGLVLAGVFGFAVFRLWGQGTALAGRYHWFGILTGIEVLAAGVGCVLLWRWGRTRWMAWWVALVVAVHFLPLAWLLDDLSLALLGLIQVGGLLVLRSRLARDTAPTSRVVGPFMGLTLLVFAAVSVVLYLARHGTTLTGGVMPSPG
ncbi:hypothetical protein [Enemella sp. A6]|uniref:hypothetical protein n=1 Tax=Enemella sp. A6 TaxID=3440152 RepID=UPI003EBC409C